MTDQLIVVVLCLHCGWAVAEDSTAAVRRRYGSDDVVASGLVSIDVVRVNN